MKRGKITLEVLATLILMAVIFGTLIYIFATKVLP